MGFFDFFKQGQSKKEEDQLLQIKDLKLAIGKIKKEQEKEALLKQALGQRRMTLSRPLIYSNPTTLAVTTGRDQRPYHGPVHDLSEIALAMDVEPYVNQSVRKHREQILKEGFIISGEDDEMVDYINRRLFEISLISGVSTNEFVREFAYNLAAYATSFLVLKRDSSKSSGRRIMWHGKKLEPIAAIYPLDPTSVSVKLNKLGHPVKWKQVIDRSASNERERTYEATDVVVATIDKKAGFVFGTPYILPVLDDVRALRRLEELAETAARKYAIPSSHWMVGNDEFPPQVFDDGTSEIGLLKAEIQNMTPEGGLVTSHRIAHEIINESDAVFDIEKYIKYYEQRVLGGLRLSPVDIGRGDVSKASAGAVSQSLQDSSRDFQAIIQDRLTNELIIPLLLEGGFNIKYDNLVKFEFPMINREEERANQQHGADLFNSSVISCTEFRQGYLGKKELDDEQKKDTKAELDHQRAKELQQMSEDTAAKQAKIKESAKSAIQNKVRPANQTGKKAIKTKITANNSLTEDTFLYKNVITVELNKRKSLINIDSVEDDARAFFDNLHVVCSFDSKKYLMNSINQGIKDGLSCIDLESYNIPKKSLDRFFKNYIGKSIKKITDGTLRYITNSKEFSDNVEVGLTSAFDQLEDDLHYLAEKQVDIAYKFGFSRALKSGGITEFYLSPDEDEACDTCKSKGDVKVSLEMKDMPYHILLSTHNLCKFNPYIKEE